MKESSRKGRAWKKKAGGKERIKNRPIQKEYEVLRRN